MATRKTFEVRRLIALANARLAVPLDNEHVNADWRRGVAALLESVLFEADAYAGFTYLAWANGGCERWRADGEPKAKEPYFGDQTRREYYVSRRLVAPAGRSGAAPPVDRAPGEPIGRLEHREASGTAPSAPRTEVR